MRSSRLQTAHARVHILSPLPERFANLSPAKHWTDHKLDGMRDDCQLIVKGLFGMSRGGVAHISAGRVTSLFGLLAEKTKRVPHF